MEIYRLSFGMSAGNTTYTFDFLLTTAKCVPLPCYADRLTSVFVALSSLVIRNSHRVTMYFHAPCGVVLYIVVCTLYANKTNISNQLKLSDILLA